MQLTLKEKADRYDSMVFAIKYMIDRFNNQAEELERGIKDPQDLSRIDCMDYGQSVAYRYAAKELGRFV